MFMYSFYFGIPKNLMTIIIFLVRGGHFAITAVRLENTVLIFRQVQYVLIIYLNDFLESYGSAAQ